MKHEYHEGQEALEKFNRTLTMLFRAPKTVSTKQVAKKAARKRKKASKG
jgi:hypothetical protein